ncbi:MAG: DMT family transporter [Gemmatimonadota bacterium]
MNDGPRGRAGIHFMLGASFFFSVMSLLVKAVGRSVPSQEIVLIRGVVTLALIRASLRAAGISPWGTRKGLLTIRGILGFAALSAFFYVVVHLPLADATVIHYTNPVFTSVIAALVLAEPIRARDAASLLFSLAGVILIARPGFLFGDGASGLDARAVGVALAGAVLSAAAYVVVRRLGQTEHHLVIVHYFAIVTTILAIPTAAPALVWPSPLAWLGLLGVGIATHIAQVLMTRGLALEPAGRAMTAGYVQIVFAAVWGLAFFGEVPDPAAGIGALLIIGSTWALGRGAGSARAGAPGSASGAVR